MFVTFTIKLRSGRLGTLGTNIGPNQITNAYLRRLRLGGGAVVHGWLGKSADVSKCLGQVIEPLTAPDAVSSACEWLEVLVEQSEASADSA